MGVAKIITIGVFALVLIPSNLLLLINVMGIARIGRVYHKVYGKYPDKPESGFKLIGCGFPRTGSLSTKLALESIGYKVYHGGDNWFHGHSKMWLGALRNRDKVDAALDELLRLGYNSTIDFPVINFCLDIVRRYPNTKVLLNVRDSPEQWYQSMLSISRILSVFLTESFPLWIYKGDYYIELLFEMMEYQGIGVEPRLKRSIFPWVDKRFFDTETSVVDEETGKMSYLKHIEDVKAAVPADQLLIFNVKQGWDPLVEFLGVEKPERSFPRTNQGKLLTLAYEIMWCYIIMYPLLLLIDVYFTYCFFRFFFRIFMKKESSIRDKTGVTEHQSKKNF